MAATNKPALAQYFEDLGIDMPPEAFVAPDIDSIVVSGANPTEWLDKDDRVVARDIDLYMIATDAGPQMTESTIRSLMGEGYVRLPSGHGFRWRGRYMPDHEIVMMRTPDRRRAWAAAQRAADARRLGRSTQSHGVPGTEGHITSQKDIQKIRGKRPPLD